MKFKNLIIAAWCLLAAVSVSAQDIISVADFAKISKNSDVVLVWAGAEDGYKVHITGAVSIPHTSLCNNQPVKTVVKPADEMAKILGAAGVSSDKTIVVYDDGAGKYAGRMYWMLKYLGAPKVKMLDGNMKAWKAGRKPITGAATTIAAATFTPKVDASTIAKLDEVKKAVGNASYVLIDARKPDEFSGKSAEGDFRKGHIPGAVNINFETLLDEQGKLKANDVLKSMFEAKGVTADKTAIVYCETSVRAGLIYLALKGLGYSKVKVYDNAYLEWQSIASNKVEL